MILIHDNNAGLHAANLSAVYMLNMFSYRDGVNVRPPWWNALTDTEVSECVHLLLLAINNSRPRFFFKVTVRLTFCFWQFCRSSKSLLPIPKTILLYLGTTLRKRWVHQAYQIWPSTQTQSKHWIQTTLCYETKAHWIRWRTNPKTTANLRTLRPTLEAASWTCATYVRMYFLNFPQGNKNNQKK